MSEELLLNTFSDIRNVNAINNKVMNRPGHNAHWDELIARYFDGLTTDDLPDAAALADDTTTDWDEREALFRDVERLIRTRLTPTQQAILRRREYEGASFETIADELSMQPAAVRMQLSRARKIIRECYQQQSHE